MIKADDKDNMTVSQTMKSSCHLMWKLKSLYVKIIYLKKIFCRKKDLKMKYAKNSWKIKIDNSFTRLYYRAWSMTYRVLPMGLQ